jgi:O-acetyl-ADP-ribose deacetylase (regulator of RNase III)
MLVHLSVAEMVVRLRSPRRRLLGYKACIRPLQGDLVLDEIYHLSHYHVSAALGPETGFIQQAYAEMQKKCLLQAASQAKGIAGETQ